MSTNGSVPNIQPLGARVLVRPLEQESRTTSGIYVPETAKEKPQTGLIIAIGDDEEIKVQVNRPQLRVRTRPGYWMAAVQD